jgi:hypothetical protein
MRGAATAAGAFTILLPRLATAYTNGDAARSAEPLVIAVLEILPGTPDEGDIARDMTQVVVRDLRQSSRFNVIDPTAGAGSVVGVDTVPNFAAWRALGVRAYMNGGLLSHQLPTKTIAHPSFFADLRCPLLEIADIPPDSPRQ